MILVLPVYLISNALFETAVLRDNSHTLFERKWMKNLINRINAFYSRTSHKKTKETEKSCHKNVRKEGVETEIKEPEIGLRFADFEQEIENGRWWFSVQEKERITMTSHDGLRLVAYYLPAEKDARKVMILMHGYRNEGLYDFAGLVKLYHDMGYHLLVPYQRSHGESEGNYICFGVKERFDLKQWADYIVKRFEGDCSIFLAGISMGGATVLMSADMALPKQVKGILADCAFTSPKDIFAKVMEMNCHLPKFPFMTVANWICRRRAGFHFNECSTIQSVKNTKIPILFIHGGKDDTVPTEMSYRNYDACNSDKHILIVDRAGHGTSGLVEPEVYRSMVMEFMEKCENRK